MSHLIDMSNYRANMAYVGQTPWHGLGSELTEGQPISVWAREAGMDWTINRAIVEYVTEKHGRNQYQGREVFYRSDTGKPLAINSNRFKLAGVQPADVLAFFNDVIKDRGFSMETAGCLKGGAVYWALAKTGLESDIVTDRIKSYLLMATACDGSMKTLNGHTSTRVVCANTLRAAVSGSKEWISTSHSTTFDADQVKKDLGLYDFEKEWAEFSAMCAKLAKIPVSPGNAKAFLGDVLSDGKFSQEVQIAYQEKGRDTAQKTVKEMEESRSFKALWETYTTGQGQDTPAAKGTAFGLVNGVTRYVDHDRRARSQDNRLYNSWFSTGATLKNRAFEYAQRIAA